MASTRPTPESYYYSGQGRLGIGSRNATTGEAYDMIFVGNVTSLTIDIATTKFEHKESMTGNRSIDLTVIQEKNATFKFTAESLKLDMLAAGLYGESGAVAGGSVSGEIHLARRGYAIPLDHPNISGLTITTVAGSTPLVEDTDYIYDAGFGTIYISAESTVVDPDPGENVSISYTYGNYDKIEAFTTGTPPERFLRFEGLNTVNGDLRMIDIYRGAFDPLTGLEFLNEELGSGEFNGNILADTTKTGTGISQFFRERRVTAPSATSAPPVVNSLVITDLADDDLVLTMSQALTSSNPAGAGGFTVAASGAAVTVSSVVVSGVTVTLNLSRVIAAGEQVYLTYVPPGSNPLGNANGTTVGFTGRAVQNNVA